MDAMMSPTQPKPKDGREKKGKGLGKVLHKVKTALRRGEASSSKLQSPMSHAATQTTGREEPAGAAHQSKPPPPVSKAAEARARYQAMDGVTKVARAQLFEERAKKLAEKYGLDMEPSDWHSVAPDDTVLRIDKPIRLRVRRTCHKCNIPFAAAKECPYCQHLRCTKCPRCPPKRTEAEKLASRERREALIKAFKENPPIIPDYTCNDRGIVLKRPSKTGGQDLYHKKPRQRVRRVCHECHALFMPGSKKCQDCYHIRCTDCPRDPPKKDKYPFGYLGDAFGPSSVPRYECVRCASLYPLDAGHGTACKKCGHGKSDASPRALPRKVEPELDPEILRAIQAKLDRLSVA